MPHSLFQVKHIRILKEIYLRSENNTNRYVEVSLKIATPLKKFPGLYVMSLTNLGNFFQITKQRNESHRQY